MAKQKNYFDGMPVLGLEKDIGRCLTYREREAVGIFFALLTEVKTHLQGRKFEIQEEIDKLDREIAVMYMNKFASQWQESIDCLINEAASS